MTALAARRHRHFLLILDLPPDCTRDVDERDDFVHGGDCVQQRLQEKHNIADFDWEIDSWNIEMNRRQYYSPRLSLRNAFAEGKGRKYPRRELITVLCVSALRIPYCALRGYAFRSLLRKLFRDNEEYEKTGWIPLPTASREWANSANIAWRERSAAGRRCIGATERRMKNY